MKTFVAAFFFFVSFATTAGAEIEKIAQVCESGICLYWWPKITPPKGWHQDQDASYGIGANALVPNGYTFENAESIMYAKALYKPRMPETKSVDALIADDKKAFLTEKPDITVMNVGTLISADGKKFQSFTFFPKGQGDWEQVAYGEEGDFYVIFTISSKTKKDFDRTQGTFTNLVSSYRQ